MTLRIHAGPQLLAGLRESSSYPAHRDYFGEVPVADRDTLIQSLESVRGRGGAAFPFATKLRALGASNRPVVVVNWAEGEPASHKDAALARVRPHLVLDGVQIVARAYRAREVHIVVPKERPAVVDAVTAAAQQRRHPKRFKVHLADDRFVAGQARAVLELMAGRPNLPVTAWQPEAYSGHRGRPTLLSNAETWAHVALRMMRPDSPATTLLTMGGESAAPDVREVEIGTSWSKVLGSWSPDAPILVGGYHGTWTSVRRLGKLPVDHDTMRMAGVPLGAGVLLAPAPGECPMTMTARLARYLADHSAGRCGPCFNGLPAMAAAVSDLAHGRGEQARVEHFFDVLERRGACAHPDGTVRLVRSLVTAFPAEVAAHRAGGCSFAERRHDPGESVA